MIKGLVLAGGKSSRMGLDKATINYHGQPQREYLFDLLKNFCEEVHLSCKNNDDTPAFLNPLSDQYEIESPLNGILTAFKKDPSAAWLAIAVDMPFIDLDTIKFLIQNRDPSKVATCFKDSDDEKPEPLFTIWEPHAYPLLLDFYNHGKISPRSFLQQYEILLLDVPDKNVLTNINSPQELNRFREGN
jgi:molybdopterin-guanine dinucleotide biosynthesis protein A